MSMRISNALAISFALAACGGRDQPETDNVDPLLEAEANAQRDLIESGMVYCAPGGATGFQPDCTIERTQTAEGLILTLRHPDGGFRRLLVTNDGRGVIAADGAEQAAVTPLSQGEIEVALGGDRYRLPATVR
ncbi:MAG: hypothetical protein RLN87_11925 [Parasphingopyxis sp.]|uniref:hypothetical protein n=1 Tax=Parasphingopyxis sp. TaxID=1920299 RepID=UPI0032EDEFFB